jgi:hypothetical protein
MNDIPAIQRNRDVVNESDFGGGHTATALPCPTTMSSKKKKQHSSSSSRQQTCFLDKNFFQWFRIPSPPLLHSSPPFRLFDRVTKKGTSRWRPLKTGSSVLVLRPNGARTPERVTRSAGKAVRNHYSNVGASP